MQSKELTDACSKLPPTLFDMPFVQLIQWFVSKKDHAKPGPLSDLFSLSNKGTYNYATTFNHNINTGGCAFIF